MSYLNLLSKDNTKIAKALEKAIRSDKSSTKKSKARQGQAYYNYEHDILNNRIFYFDDNGVLQEDKHASNIKIPHAFHTELVDQKVQYLLSNPVEVTVEDDQLQEYLDEYYDEDFQLFLQEALEGVSNKGFEYIFARTTNENRLAFQVSDSLSTFPVYDADNELGAIIRYYDKEIEVDGETEVTTYAEIWNDKQVKFFIKKKDEDFKFDNNREMNPMPHVVGKDEEGTIYSRSYNRNPFYRLSNNKAEKTDLEPIKELIDDYDIMAAYLSNNLQDFADAIYVVKGFRGDDLTELRQNVKSKKVIGTKSDGDLDIKTIEIPYEARKVKLEIDKEAIYKFGMGFDSSQVGDGNITNIVIKSRYALLDMKANKTEVRLRAALKWMNELIIDDINRRYNESYDSKDIEIEIVRETMVNENDLAENEKIKAETKETLIHALVSANPYLSDLDITEQICEIFDLDLDEVKKRLEEDDGYLDDSIDEVDADGEPEPVAERTS